MARARRSSCDVGGVETNIDMRVLDDIFLDAIDVFGKFGDWISVVYERFDQCPLRSQIACVVFLSESENVEGNVCGLELRKFATGGLQHRSATIVVPIITQLNVIVERAAMDDYIQMRMTHLDKSGKIVEIPTPTDNEVGRHAGAIVDGACDLMVRPSFADGDLADTTVRDNGNFHIVWVVWRP